MALHIEYGRGYKRIEAKGLLSRFYMMHPMVLFLYYISAFFFVLSYSNPIFVVTSYFLVLLIAFYFGGLKKTFKALKMSMYIGILVFLINPIINHRGNNILFYLLGNPITLEATLFGFFNMIMIISMLLLFVSFNVLLDSQRFLYLFSRILPKISFITNMSLRFVSLLIKRAKEISGVLSVRGIDIRSGKKINLIKNSGKILATLSQWSLEDGMEVAQTLKAKGYGGTKRTCYQSFIFTQRDMVLFIVLLIFTLLSFWLSSINVRRYSFYPRLNVIKFDFNDIITYIIMVLTLVMPFIVEAVYKLIYKIRIKRTGINFGVTRKYN